MIDLETKKNEIMKEKDLDLGKQRKLLSELSEADKKNDILTTRLNEIDTKLSDIKNDMLVEENISNNTERNLKKNFDEINIRNNSLANDLQALRRNYANLQEQLD